MYKQRGTRQKGDWQSLKKKESLTWKGSISKKIFILIISRKNLVSKMEEMKNAAKTLKAFEVFSMFSDLIKKNGAKTVKSKLNMEWSEGKIETAVVNELFRWDVKELSYNISISVTLHKIYPGKMTLWDIYTLQKVDKRTFTIMGHMQCTDGLRLEVYALHYQRSFAKINLCNDYFDENPDWISFMLLFPIIFLKSSFM